MQVARRHKIRPSLLDLDLQGSTGSTTTAVSATPPLGFIRLGFGKDRGKGAPDHGVIGMSDRLGL